MSECVTELTIFDETATPPEDAVEAIALVDAATAVRVEAGGMAMMADEGVLAVEMAKPRHAFPPIPLSTRPHKIHKKD